MNDDVVLLDVAVAQCVLIAEFIHHVAHVALKRRLIVHVERGQQIVARLAAKLAHL
jgi:hypothetical protein